MLTAIFEDGTSYSPPGQKEVRYIHLLGHVSENVPDSNAERSSNATIFTLEERVTNLENQLEALRNDFDKLMKELS